VVLCRFNTPLRGRVLEALYFTNQILAGCLAMEVKVKHSLQVLINYFLSIFIIIITSIINIKTTDKIPKDAKYDSLVSMRVFEYNIVKKEGIKNNIKYIIFFFSTYRYANANSIAAKKMHGTVPMKLYMLV
jgi:hypothetical protein